MPDWIRVDWLAPFREPADVAIWEFDTVHKATFVELCKGLDHLTFSCVAICRLSPD